MDEGDGHRSLADGGGATLDRAMPYIAGGKYAGQVGFEIKRIALERPIGRPFLSAHQIAASHQVAAVVAHGADACAVMRVPSSR